MSVLAASILLAYALARFSALPGPGVAVQLPGMYVAIPLNEQTLVALLVAALTAAGADWLMSDHPALAGRATFEHWLLPALTAWVIGIPLLALPPGWLWWGGFALGGLLLMLVLTAEYIVIDPHDSRRLPASIGLMAISFALFLGLAVTLRVTGTRLYLLLPALGLAGFLVSLRTLHLRLGGRWGLIQATLTALITVELAAALHYWPLTPIPFGLATLGPAYALTGLMVGLSQGESLRQAAVEPAIVLALLWGGALWLR
jgi:hypothetical protein